MSRRTDDSSRKDLQGSHGLSTCQKVDYALNSTHPFIKSKLIADQIDTLNAASLQFSLAEDALAKGDMACFMSE
jgi:hypothetical protein